MPQKTTSIAALVIIGIGVVAVLVMHRANMLPTAGTSVSDTDPTVTVGNSQEENKRLAQQIITEVRALIDIPEDVEPTVATIVDVDLLREQNPFYEKAENGDHLVVTRERAILYNSREKKIIDVIPVQLEPVEAQ